MPPNNYIDGTIVNDDLFWKPRFFDADITLQEVSRWTKIATWYRLTTLSQFSGMERCSGSVAFVETFQGRSFHVQRDAVFRS